jgi:hypothetical protein
VTFPSSTTRYVKRPTRQVLEFELTRGVAGSRKTQHAVDRAHAAGSKGEVANVLFLVKVGSNAQEIRSRMEAQHGLAFQRHRMTNHFVARSWDKQGQGEGGPKRRGRRRTKAAADDGGGLGGGGLGGSYWVSSFDAFVDCQLRAHEAMQEPLRTRGANFEWKVRFRGVGV